MLLIFQLLARDKQVAFFLREPVQVLGRTHGLWLALAPLVSAILKPHIKAAKSMPLEILANARMLEPAPRPGLGYLILQAEGTFGVNTVFAGIKVLTTCALAPHGVVGHWSGIC